MRALEGVRACRPCGIWAAPEGSYIAGSYARELREGHIGPVTDSTCLREPITILFSSVAPAHCRRQMASIFNLLEGQAEANESHTIKL